MSLLKTLTNTYTMASPESIKEDFKYSTIIAAESDNVTDTQVAALIALYTEYSICYLQAVAITLDDPVGMQSTMKYMNSLIAEFMHAASLHYYHKEAGYSVIDKAIQQALDSEGTISIEEVKVLMGEIELSYVEEEEEVE